MRFGGGSRFYYVTDHLGSAIGMFNSTGDWVGGYSYSPYGELRHVGSNTALTTSSVRYIGGYHDSESGLYKLGARYYDESLGRFTQMDPSGQEANPYLYGAGNPVSNSDLSGLVASSAQFAAGALVFGALAVVMTFSGFGLAAAALGLVSTGLDVAGNLVEGDTAGAAASALMGLFTLGIGAGGSALGVSTKLLGTVEFGYYGLGSILSSFM